jgi:hypothetical protein
VGVILIKNRNYFRFKYHELKGLCYTVTMQPDRSYWPEWARTLQRWGLNEFVAALLEAAGPLSIFLAQAVYLGEPLLSGIVSGSRLQALAGLFEDQEESRSFATYLREENSA